MNYTNKQDEKFEFELIIITMLSKQNRSINNENLPNGGNEFPDKWLNTFETIVNKQSYIQF